MPRACVRTVATLALVGCVTALTSCRPAAKYEPLPETGATLEGTVTYGTDQLAAAVVIVAGANGPAVQGKIGDDGRYVVKDAPLGPVRIGVSTGAAKAAARANGPGAAPKKLIDVPGKYTDPTKSGISTTVNSGSNAYDIVIPK